MPSFELTGTIKAIMDVVKFDSGFTKREFVVTTEGERFPQAIKFECVKERCALLDGLSEGQPVTVSFDIRGNEYKGRHFVSLSAWKIVPAEQASEREDAAGASDERDGGGRRMRSTPAFAESEGSPSRQPAADAEDETPF